MIMYKFISIVLICLMANSCSESIKTTESVNTFKWNVKNEDGSPFKSLEYDYVILKNEPKQRFIGSIEKVVHYNNELYVKSKSNLNVYDESGRYKRSIGNIGNAENEYIEFSDFSIYDSVVYVIDWRKQSMLSYRLNGDFIKQARTPISHVSGVLAVNDGFVFYRPKYNAEIPDDLFNFALTITDLDLNIIRQELAYDENSPTVSNYPAFIEYGDTAFFYQFLTDNLLQLSRKDTTKIVYGFDFLSEKILPSQIQKYDLIYSNNGNKRFFNCAPVILNDWIFGRTSINQKSKNFAIDISSGDIYEDETALNVFSNTISLGENCMMIPYEVLDRNLNHKNLPDSVQIASENGENVIIKAYINH